MEESKIGGIPLTDWKRAFARSAAIAIDKDYFSDILYYDLYSEFNNEEEVDKAWENVSLAFKEIFKEDYYNLL